MNFTCPHESFDILDNLWRNYTSVNWNQSYDQYLCRYAEYYDRRNRIDTIEGHLVLFFSGVGFIGGLLTVLTMTQAAFRGLNFRLFLFIGYLEMLQMAILALMDSLAYVRCDVSYSCTFLWAHVGITILNVCADATDILVLFLCVERIVACLLPHHFQTVHNIRCYKVAIAVSIVSPTIFSMLQAFELAVVYDAESERFADEPSSFSQTAFYAYVKKINTVRFYVTATLIAITTGLSIWGFVSVARRRKKLNRRKGQAEPTSSSTKESVEFSYSSVSGVQRPKRTSRFSRKSSRSTRNRQMELCCLQLCLAVPVVINHILYGTGLSANYLFMVGEAAVKKISTNEMTFHQATREIERAESFQYLRAATNVSNVMAHALHFYLYVMFSVKVRQGFLTLWDWRRCRRTANRRSMSTSAVQTNSPFRSTVFNAC